MMGVDRVTMKNELRQELGRRDDLDYSDEGGANIAELEIERHTLRQVCMILYPVESQLVEREIRMQKFGLTSAVFDQLKRPLEYELWKEFQRIEGTYSPEWWDSQLDVKPLLPDEILMPVDIWGTNTPQVIVPQGEKPVFGPYNQEREVLSEVIDLDSVKRISALAGAEVDGRVAASSIVDLQPQLVGMYRWVDSSPDPVKVDQKIAARCKIIFVVDVKNSQSRGMSLVERVDNLHVPFVCGAGKHVSTEVRFLTYHELERYPAIKESANRTSAYVYANFCCKGSKCGKNNKSPTVAGMRFEYNIGNALMEVVFPIHVVASRREATVLSSRVEAYRDRVEKPDRRSQYPNRLKIRDHPKDYVPGPPVEGGEVLDVTLSPYISSLKRWGASDWIRRFHVNRTAAAGDVLPFGGWRCPGCRGRVGLEEDVVRHRYACESYRRLPVTKKGMFCGTVCKVCGQMVENKDLDVHVVNCY